MQGYFYFAAIDYLTLKLVSWRTTAADDKQSETRIARPADMLKEFPRIFEEYFVLHWYETVVKPLSLSFPIDRNGISSMSGLESSMKTQIQNYLRMTKENLHKQEDKMKLDIVAFNAGKAKDVQLDVTDVSRGNWIRKLVSTSLQVARIENHCLVPVKTDGFKLIVKNVASPEQLVPKISFGLVKPLFADASQKQQPIK